MTQVIALTDFADAFAAKVNSLDVPDIHPAGATHGGGRDNVTPSKDRGNSRAYILARLGTGSMPCVLLRRAGALIWSSS